MTPGNIHVLKDCPAKEDYILFNLHISKLCLWQNSKIREGRGFEVFVRSINVKSKDVNIWLFLKLYNKMMRSYLTIEDLV